MAKKVTPEMVREMIELYSLIGTYSGVAKELGVSASTVSKYIKKEKSIKNFSFYSGPQPTLPKKNDILGFSFLSTDEAQSLNKWLEEF